MLCNVTVLSVHFLACPKGHPYHIGDVSDLRFIVPLALVPAQCMCRTSLDSKLLTTLWHIQWYNVLHQCFYCCVACKHGESTVKYMILMPSLNIPCNAWVSNVENGLWWLEFCYGGCNLFVEVCLTRVHFTRIKILHTLYAFSKYHCVNTETGKHVSVKWSIFQLYAYEFTCASFVAMLHSWHSVTNE